MDVSVITHPTFAVINPTGRITATTAPRMREAIDALITAGSVRIVLDLSSTEFIDSSGLGAVIGGLKAARVAGGDLRIAAVPEPVRRVLKLTNLDRVLREHPTPESAFDGD
jgi:anti-sigma B factor antagonist